MRVLRSSRIDIKDLPRTFTLSNVGYFWGACFIMKPVNSQRSILSHQYHQQQRYSRTTATTTHPAHIHPSHPSNKRRTSTVPTHDPKNTSHCRGWVGDKLLHRHSSDVEVALDCMMGVHFARIVQSYKNSAHQQQHDNDLMRTTEGDARITDQQERYNSYTNRRSGYRWWQPLIG